MKPDWFFFGVRYLKLQLLCSVNRDKPTFPPLGFWLHGLTGYAQEKGFRQRQRYHLPSLGEKRCRIHDRDGGRGGTRAERRQDEEDS